MHDFDIAHDSLGEPKKIVKAIMSVSASDYLVKQELAVLRVRIKLEGGQVFNGPGRAASFITCFSKAIHNSSCGTEDNIEPSTMECDTKDFINGLSEQKFGMSDWALQYLMVDALQ